MASVVSVVILCFAVIGISHSHLCLLSPAQRGSLQGINKPGAADCFLVKSPCGGRQKQSNETVDLRVGQEYKVVFQKNLDHWKKESPGFFAVYLGRENDLNYQVIGKVLDQGEPSLHIYTTSVVIPVVPWMNKDGVLQVTYETKNPDAPAAFYQCADVHILPKL